MTSTDAEWAEIYRELESVRRAKASLAGRRSVFDSIPYNLMRCALLEREIELMLVVAQDKRGDEIK